MDMKTLVVVLRWLARIGSLGSIGLLGAFLLGEGLPPFTVKSMLFPFGVMLGLVLAWRFEILGGLVAIASLLWFYALEYLNHGNFPGGPAFLLITAPGLLFLICGVLKPSRDHRPLADPGRMVEVLTTFDAGELAVVKSLLDGEQISHHAQGEEYSITRGGGTLPVRVLVPAAHADRARELIEELLDNRTRPK